MTAAASEPKREGPIHLRYGRDGIAVTCDDCDMQKWAAGRNAADKIVRTHVCKGKRR